MSADRADVYKAADRCGWTVALKPNKKNYLKMKCGCGKHMSWLHKSPSNPNYYAERVGFIERTCCGSRKAPDGPIQKRRASQKVPTGVKKAAKPTDVTKGPPKPRR